MKWCTILTRKFSSVPVKQSRARSYQKHLLQAIHILFPDYKTITNARKASGISNDASHELELDVWIPALKLAFEFQDPHHYGSATYAPRSFEEIKRNDEIKIKIMKDRGETLIAIPFWWDGQLESLIETIRKRRPELVKQYKVGPHPIPTEPPAGLVTDIAVPGVGEVMNATFVYRTSDFSDFWWMGEKYDGLRALWNPKSRTLYSRMGKRISFPATFRHLLPSIFLDGELWAGRQNYKDAHSVLDRPEEVPWEDMRFLVFDLPEASVQSDPLEQRYSSLLLSVPPHHPFTIPTGMQKFTGSTPLRSLTQLILDSGGEGTVARKCKSIYFCGRSTEFLKLKATRDLEGLVIADFGDSTYEISLTNEETVTAKLAPNLDTTIPKTGDVVTLTYERFKQSGDLVTPRIVRVRKDLEWDDVLSGDSTKKVANKLAGLALRGGKTVQMPRGHWTVEGSTNVRRFFDRYAQNHGKDPLDPKTWYSIKLKDIIKMPSGGSVLKHYNGSAIKAIIDVYPSLNLSPGDFDHMTHKYWQKLENRKQFFDTIAKKMNFDPLLAENWYNLPYSSYYDEKLAYSVLTFYNGSIQRALADTYPEIGIDSFHFRIVGRSYWRSSGNRKRFFDSYAKKRNFDPLNANNWYSVSQSTLVAEKGGISVMIRYYKTDLSRGLKDVYPTMKIDESLFQENLESYYHAAANRKKFFEDFAQKQGLDALVPETWRRFSEQDILKEKAGKHVLSRYGGILANALSALFPQQGKRADIL
eukprot:Phypoly_transcript_03337.p1 GENE.Phypoly_transcript_03337~~Phypoly_transcript_03337.p1  ORF type:complete len:777 (+),score=98.56 Phypoly_transcript_03337:66-2333(+)